MILIMIHYPGGFAQFYGTVGARLRGLVRRGAAGERAARAADSREASL